MGSAVRAEFGTVALIIGGDVQGGQKGLDLASRDQDDTVAGWFRLRRFGPGRRWLVDVGAERVVLGALVVPATALVVPLFLLEHDVHLTNTYEGVILPLMVYPFGVYFMSIFAADAVPDTLIDSCRMDGAGEFRTFWQIGRPILMPGMVTLFLLSFIGTWNNYFLPLVLLGTESRFPLTVGLGAWASDLNLAGAGQPVLDEAVVGELEHLLGPDAGKAEDFDDRPCPERVVFLEVEVPLSAARGIT